MFFWISIYIMQKRENSIVMSINDKVRFVSIPEEWSTKNYRVFPEDIKIILIPGFFGQFLHIVLRGSFWYYV